MRLREAIRDGRQNLVETLCALAEFDHRRLHAQEGYSSLFSYCVDNLLLSEDEAFRRIRVARISRKYPAILSYLADGSISLSVATGIAPHLTPANHAELMARAQWKRVTEARRLLGEFGIPEPPPAERIRWIRTSSSDGEESPMIQMTFTGNKEFHDLLQRAKKRLERKYPRGKLEDIFREALEALLHSDEKIRKPKSPRGRERPRAAFSPVSASKSRQSAKRSRRVPKIVRDQVWERDGGRCTFINREGDRCRGTQYLEIDHIIPWARGGRSDTPENLRLLCREHNQLEARKAFGAERTTDRNKIPRVQNGDSPV